jgi:hypothetical protein
MRTNAAPAFCPVCEKAVERMILFLTEWFSFIGVC